MRLPFLLLLAVGLLVSCKKDETKTDPSPTPTPTLPDQRVVLLVFNASFDSLSGSQFKPFLARMKKDYPETPVVSMHISGPAPAQTDLLYNTSVQAVNNWLPAHFTASETHPIPYCYFGANSALKGIKRTDFTDLWSNMVQYIAESKAVPPVASVDFNTQIRNDSLLVNTTSSFHANINYGVTMAIYLIEDDVPGSQVNDASSNPGEHDNVLRSMPTDPYGDFFIRQPGNGQQIKGLYKMKLEPDWNRSKLSVVAALWYNKGADGMILCNGTVKKIGS